jgi:hypothetical protein
VGWGAGNSFELFFRGAAGGEGGGRRSVSVLLVGLSYLRLGEGFFPSVGRGNDYHQWTGSLNPVGQRGNVLIIQWPGFSPSVGEGMFFITNVYHHGQVCFLPSKRTLSDGWQW